MPHVEMLKDIPKERIDAIQARYREEGATVTVIRQSDGKFTVQASWPETEVRFSSPAAKA